jgi:hypothetical protein
VKRLTTLFLIILAVGSFLWPWLREIGLMGLPGDVMTEFQGYRLHLPISTALLISGAMYGAWRMLQPPS